ncbi:TRAP transporter small permease subunit [Celeribacter naphthalenivorans]|uniref:TRAP transporter small permease subunit n=1 Tax=Celeribacter naphthalenivorans TaxID=1614694 RepID=UPI001CF9BBA0|nr:TRAP transporter small permease [Celeribacter naphthalenivorans]
MTLKTTHARLETVARVAATAGGLGIIFISITVTLDVLLRKFFHVTFGGANEMAGFIFAVATALSYPIVLLDRANVRIDVLYTFLPLKIRAFLDFLAMLLVLYFVAFLTKSVFGLLVKSWTHDSMSIGVFSIPLWVPQSIWVLGFALFTLTALFLCVYAAVSLFKRDWSTVTAIAGVPSLDETIEEETYIDVEEPRDDSGKGT